eukprot:gene27311-18034_t
MPLLHIVLLKLKEGEANPAVIEQVCARLMELQKLDCVTQCSAGPLDTDCYEGMADRSKGYHIGYMATIDNRENLQSYAQSGLHLAIVRETIKPVIAPDGILAFDYVVPPTANFGLPGALLHIVLFRTDPAVSAGAAKGLPVWV